MWRLNCVALRSGAPGLARLESLWPSGMAHPFAGKVPGHHLRNHLHMIIWQYNRIRLLVRFDACPTSSAEACQYGVLLEPRSLLPACTCRTCFHFPEARALATGVWIISWDKAKRPACAVYRPEALWRGLTEGAAMHLRIKSLYIGEAHIYGI